MRSKIVVLSLTGLFTVSLAWAQATSSWGDYEAAFPKYPCQDGWMGCVQEGRRVDPALGTDGKGMPTSSDLRVGWFDLEATSTFSPFTGLSKYSGDKPAEIGDAAAQVDEPDPENPEDPSTDDPEDGVAEVDFFDPEAERARKAAESMRLEEAEARKAEERAKEEAERARREEAKAQRQAEEQSQAALRAMEAATAASNAAEKQRLEAEAVRKKADADRARVQAEQAEKLRREREAREAEETQRAAAAAKEAERAEEERKRREAEEAKMAEQRRQDEIERQKAAAAEAKAAADAARLKAEKEAEAAAKVAEKRAADAAAAAAAAQDAAEKERLEREAAEAEAARKRAAEEAKAKADAEAKKAADAAKMRAEEEARAAKAAEQARLEEERKQIEDEEKAKRMEAAGTSEDAAAVGGCSDLVSLEPVAILGKLEANQTSCLESNLGTASRMTEKSKISRMLMVNAFSAGKTSEWETLIKRHLQEIEQSDPDLCYKYSLHLSKKGVGSQFEVIRWANVALENRMVWTGNTYTQRVYSLFKIRAAASQKIWQHRENKHAANPTEETNQKAKDARNQTKEYAREWYEYAKVAGKDVTTALEVCMMAAGTKDYCEAG